MNDLIKSIRGSTVVAIDPGRSKSGLAVVSGPASLQVHSQSVVASDRVVEAAASLVHEFGPVYGIVIGDGTGSAVIVKGLKDKLRDITIFSVNERGTSEQARRRFIEREPASLLQRLIPKGLRSPNRPYDDYVAVILAEQFLRTLNQ